MEENYKSLEQFFKSDSNIKEILFKSAPTNLLGQDSAIEYSDKLDSAIEDIIFEMNQILSQDTFEFPQETKKEIVEKLKNIKKRIQSTLNPEELKKIYVECFSDMSPQFVKDVGNIFAGYLCEKAHYYNDGHKIDANSVLGETKTVNEMLHYVHSYICNDEYLYSKMPVLTEKEITPYSKCVLFGIQNPIAMDIFENIPTQTESIGETYIIGLKNKVLMMVRDAGHALTIDIDINDKEKIGDVRYFVPKICNIEKINTIRGINKIPTNAELSDMTASGMFENSLDGFGKSVVDFIMTVPTDIDIERNFPVNNENAGVKTIGFDEFKGWTQEEVQGEKITNSEVNGARGFIKRILNVMKREK